MTDKHHNAHRANKKSFQVMLTNDESKLLAAVKKSRAIETNKSLLITLLHEEKLRLQLLK